MMLTMLPRLVRSHVTGAAPARGRATCRGVGMEGTQALAGLRTARTTTLGGGLGDRGPRGTALSWDSLIKQIFPDTSTCQAQH